jgi:hypothetical protein
MSESIPHVQPPPFRVAVPTQTGAHMHIRTAFVVAVLMASPVHAQSVEKQTVLTITSEQIEAGILSEITWDGGVLMLQGVIAQPDGQLSARYFVVPAAGVTLEKRKEGTPAADKYWTSKANRISPTGLGKITGGSDQSMPMYGVAAGREGQQQRIAEAYLMGGMQEKNVLRIGTLVIHERTNNVEPYDGEVWSWSPPELNRVAYVDGKGDLWVAYADGRNPRKLLKGDFTLPAWSEDGKVIAVAEKKDGRTWVISVVHLPEAVRKP